MASARTPGSRRKLPESFWRHPSRAATIYKELPLKKSRPTRPRLSDAEKQEIRQHYGALRDDWCLELEEPEIDWEFLFELHYDMLQLEQQFPWLKKAVA
jgi:hypothetical protein